MKIELEVKVIEEYKNFVLGELELESNSISCYVIIETSAKKIIAQENTKNYIYEYWNELKQDSEDGIV